MFYGDTNVQADILSSITLASLDGMLKWNYCFIQFLPKNLMTYGGNLILINRPQDDEVDTTEMEGCIDDINDFHFKKHKSYILKKDYTLKDNNDDYFVVYMDWLIRKCDIYNKENFEKTEIYSRKVYYQIFIKSLISCQHNRCVICDQHFHFLHMRTFDRVDTNKSQFWKIVFCVVVNVTKEEVVKVLNI
jgi:hypothetical protein